MEKNDIKIIAEWLLSGDTGVSSKTMAAIAMGAEKGRFDAPHDPSDFWRCCRLVQLVPSIRDSFVRIGQLVPVFAGILREWDHLYQLLERDMASGKCQELYDRIKELRAEAVSTNKG